MPVRFICPACRQLLSVASRKIGSEVKCPKCSAALIVPGESDAAATSSTREGGSADANLSDLIVYDDIPAAVDAPPVVNTAKATSALPAEVDRRLVTFPRYVLYAQGALIAVVGLVAFVLGIAFGRAGAPRHEAEAPKEPVRIEGNVTYQSQSRPGQDQADVGAVVVVVPIVPKEKFPVPRLSTQGLRPQDPPQTEGNDDAIKAIESIEGSYQRVPAGGKFEFMAKPGRYHVLVVSRNATRPKIMPLVPDHLAILGDYFESANELIGNYQYSLASHDLPHDAPLEIAFRAASR